MTDRPCNLLRRVPGVVAPTFTAHRLGASRHRNPCPWRGVRRKKSYTQTPATLDSAIAAARTSAAAVRQSQRDAEQRLASIWRRADFGKNVEPFALSAVHRAHDSNSRWRVRGVAAWASYVGRLITFNVAVIIIHLGVLRWIFLPIGG
jgi:hypothetical protein